MTIIDSCPRIRLALAVAILTLPLPAQQPGADAGPRADRPAPTDSLDGWWTEAEALLAGADPARPELEEANRLLDEAALSESWTEARDLARRACELLRGIQIDGEAPPMEPAPDRPAPDRPGRDRPALDRPAPDRPAGDGPLRRRLQDRRPGDGAPPPGPERGEPQRGMRQLAEMAPELLEALRAGEIPPEEARQRMRELVELRRTRPELFELELADMRKTREVDRLAGEVREMSERPREEPGGGADAAAAIAEREARLATAVAELFDLRMRKHEAQIEARREESRRLEREIEEESKLLQDRKEARDQLIQERIDRLLGRSSRRAW